MDGLPWDQVGIGSGWALVALCVWLIFTGRLVPRSILEDAKHDAQEWRAEGRIKDQQIAVKDTQLRHLDEVGRTVDAIMRSLQRARNPVDTDGSHHDVA